MSSVQQQNIPELVTPDKELWQTQLKQIALAIKKYTLACSSTLGVDCLLHAQLAERACRDWAHIDAKLVIGYAAWRVGDGDADVILHCPNMPVVDSKGVVYHAWLEMHGYIFDCSTHLLRHKAELLDAWDGKVTQVDWCPDYLLEKRTKVSCLENVIQDTAGLFFYQYDAAVQNFITTNNEPLHEEDWRDFQMVLHNTNLHVVGPNNYFLKELVSTNGVTNVPTYQHLYSKNRKV